MRPPKLFRSKHDVAVVGLYASGKTVFLTSFINHIQNHRPDLKIGDGGTVRITFDEEIPPLNGFERFPYEEFRCENKSEWPKKTKTCYEYRCTFFRNDWRWTKGELALVDIPGERLADIPMAKLSYSKWSDWLLERVFQDQQYREQSREFLAALAAPRDTDESAIIKAYCSLLGGLYRSYRPVITPSTFLLKEDGFFTGSSVSKNDLSDSFAGIDARSQFAPLPRKVRKAVPGLAKEFERRYKDYQQRIAGRLVRTLVACNEMAILVDVTTLLAANTGMYNGNRALLEQFLRIISPGNDFFGVGLNLLRRTFGGHLRQRGISRIAVMATKADKVHDSQRGKLASLATDMCDPIVERLVLQKMQLECRYFGCAAVKSTRSLPNGKLRGRFDENAQDVEYAASELPDTWPGTWDEGDYAFPDVKPSFPDNNALPPDHLAMDDVIDFLLKP